MKRSFSNLKIRTRLLFILVMNGIYMVATGAVGYRGIKNISDLTLGMLKSDARISEYSARACANVKHVWPGRFY